MSVVVAEEGNKRVGEMTNAEITQCALDIKSWFSRTKCQKNINSGASNSDFQRLQKALDNKIPSSLRLLLSEFNGGIFYMEKEMLSTDKIIEIHSAVDGSKKWKPHFIPFCGDENAMLIIDTNNDDEVKEWDSDDGAGDVVSNSIVRFLEDYRNDLLSGHFEYLDGVGVVEKMGKSKK